MAPRLAGENACSRIYYQYSTKLTLICMVRQSLVYGAILLWTASEVIQAICCQSSNVPCRNLRHPYHANSMLRIYANPGLGARLRHYFRHGSMHLAVPLRSPSLE
jgi:hypothetical protein